MLRFKFQLGVATALCLAVFALPASANLIDRGNGLIYDTALDITWLQNADMGGLVTWSDAKTWAQNLDYQGYSDWRLPSMDVSGSGVVNCNFSITTKSECQDNELGYLYYYELTPANDPGGSPTEFGTDLSRSNIPEPFQNIPPGIWSGTQSGPGAAWAFVFANGDQFRVDESNFHGAWAVRPGDVVAAVPGPPTWPLLVLGLGVIGWGAWRRRPRLG